MRLPPRRFPDTITRKRTTLTVNDFGETVETTTESEMPANVQPMTVDDVPTAGGVSLQSRFRVFARGADSLLATDAIVIDGVTFNVDVVQPWRGSHVRAEVIEET